MADMNNCKIICKELKKARIELAKVNNITFKTVECTYNGPCNGTCPKCDEENLYLKKELEKLENPVYPDMDVEKERNMVDEIFGDRKKLSRTYGRGGTATSSISDKDIG